MRCDQCKSWNKDETRQASGANLTTVKVGWCQRALQWWDATEWTDEPDPNSEWETIRRVVPEAEGTKMFVQDGSDYLAYLYTTADFYCAHFDRAP